MINLEEMKLDIDGQAEENNISGDDDGMSGPKMLNSRRAIIHLGRRHHYSEPTCGKQMLYCLLSNQNFRQKRKRLALAKGNIINSVSKIDNLSRVIFPVSFFLIIFCYCWHYFTADDIFTWKALDQFKFY